MPNKDKDIKKAKELKNKNIFSFLYIEKRAKAKNKYKKPPLKKMQTDKSRYTYSRENLLYTNTKNNSPRITKPALSTSKAELITPGNKIKTTTGLTGDYNKYVCIVDVTKTNFMLFFCKTIKFFV